MSFLRILFILMMLFQASPAFQPRIFFRRVSCTYIQAEPSSLDQLLIQAAEVLLPWEAAAERENAAVLDLSNWNKADSGLALSDTIAVEIQSVCDDGGSAPENVDMKDGAVCATWRNGDIWKRNREALVDRSILPLNCKPGSKEERDLLKASPQLIRIHPDDVSASIDAALDLGIPISLLQSEPCIFAYPREYICEGTLNFLSNMMMLRSKDVALSLCKSTPKLFLASIEGYMQEQSVRKALGAASDAVYSASKSVAADVSDRIRAQRRKRGT